MRQFDNKGLAVAKYQAEIFESSVDQCECSSPYFVRRYLKSGVLKELESKDADLLSLDVHAAMDTIQREFGSLKYGSIKYSKDAMFWIGYIYAYICYTRQCRLALAYKMIGPDALAKRFYVWHTQSEEWCIARILEECGETEDYFDVNYRVQRNLRERYR